MDRRGFFKALAGTAIAAAVLPEIWTSSKAIFLPPRGGWFQSPLVMREVRQYVINIDSMPMRYDVAWDVYQYHVDFPEIQDWHRLQMNAPALYAQLLEEQRRIARLQFEQLRRRHGFSNADQRTLPLIRGADLARYV